MNNFIILIFIISVVCIVTNTSTILLFQKIVKIKLFRGKKNTYLNEIVSQGRSVGLSMKTKMVITTVQAKKISQQ